MTSTTRIQRKYDHRLRALVRTTGNLDYATQRGVPRSTARGWLKSTPAEVVSLDVVDMDRLRLQQEVLRLQSRLDRLVALLRLVIIVLKVSGISLAKMRFPECTAKLRLLRAIDRSCSVFPLRIVLRVLGLSPSRYHAWKRGEECALDDLSSCPRLSSHQLTSTEVATIREMVTADEYRHASTGTLALLAQRLGRVFASPSTWYRLVRLYNWRRPRQRVYPDKPKFGIRAIRYNDIWHIDTTLIRLLDGSRVYLQAIIDNFSRRILAWRVSESFDPSGTAELLLNAAKGIFNEKPTLLADGGVENFNSAVDELVESGLLKRLLAQTEITYSNSLIESWWRVLKHQWVYLNTLDTMATVRTLIAFYVEQHNSHLPHSAFRSQTPDEMYYGTGKDIPRDLEVARQSAREMRLQTHRKMSCRTCETVTSIAG